MTASWYYNFWEDWQLYHKVTFDGVNKLIIVNYGETTLDFGEDVYSAWKEWILVRENAKYLAALRTVGGDPTVGTDALGGTYFLINDWQMRTWEGDHTLTIVGNFYQDDGLPRFVPTLRPHNIQIFGQVSNLIDRIVQEVGALTEEEANQLEVAWKNSKLIIPIFSNTS